MGESQNHALVTNAMVSVTDPEGSNVGMNVQLESNSTSIVTFTSCELGEHTVNVRAENFEDEERKIIVSCNNNNNNNENTRIDAPILLSPSCGCTSIEASILSIRNESALQTAQVSVSAPDGSILLENAPVDDEGAVVIETCQVGNHWITVTAEDFFKKVTLIEIVCQPENSTIENSILLTPLCECVEGNIIVTDSQNNEAITDAMIVVTDPEGLDIATDSDGDVSFESCRTGEFTVTVTADGFRSDTSSLEVECRSSNFTLTNTIVLVGLDGDEDGIIDIDDNCPQVANPNQVDTDNDGLGNACDTDRDNDGLENIEDNCPTIPNVDQQDSNTNGIGDACEGVVDSDQDGVPDDNDNCPNIPNADQLDSDDDGDGNPCDADQDNDGILNTEDNCPIVSNADQLNTDGDETGDACEDDCDGDGILDDVDVCPCNNFIDMTDFADVLTLDMGENSDDQDPTEWQIGNGGTDILQFNNSAPGIAIGQARLHAVEFEGVMEVNDETDDDWIGVVFSYQVYNINAFKIDVLLYNCVQDDSNFYLFMSSKDGSGQGGWQLKRVTSTTGPVGTELSNAIRFPELLNQVHS